jgi:hypothetical protein
MEARFSIFQQCPKGVKRGRSGRSEFVVIVLGEVWLCGNVETARQKAGRPPLLRCVLEGRSIS